MLIFHVWEEVVRLKWPQTLGIVAVLPVLLAGCATFSQPPSREAKQCSDSPRGAVARFLEGIIGWSLTPIRLVIAEGMSALGVFGDGDTWKGWEVAKQLYRHPEVVDHQSEVGIRHLMPVEMTDLGNGETRVLLERKDVVTKVSPEGTPIEETEKVFRRNFAVRFQGGTNCITAVRAMDPQWVRIE